MEANRAMNLAGDGDKISLRRRRLWGALKIALALAAWTMASLSLISLYQDSANGVGYDFYEAWVGGDVLRTSQAAGYVGAVDLYSDKAFHEIGKRYEALAQTKSRRLRLAAPARRGLYTASTPFLYWVFSILTPGDYDRVFNAYRLIAMGCLVVSIAAVGWRQRYSIAGIGAAVMLAALTNAAYSDFIVANINCPQLAACLAYLFLRDQARRRASIAWVLYTVAGVVMGMLIALKPNLLMLPLLLGFSGIVSARWRSVFVETAGLAIGLATAVAVSSWRFGSLAWWLDWTRMIQKLGSQLSMPSGYGNISISRSLLELTDKNFFVPLAIFVMLCAVGAIWLGTRHKEGRAARDAQPLTGAQDRDMEFRRDLTLFGLAETMTFITSGLAWLHYPILIFPFVMLLTSRPMPRETGNARKIVRYVIAAIVILLLMFPPVPSIQWYLPIKINQTPLLLIVCAQIATVLSFGMGLWLVLGNE